jgi:peptide/nickel transport system substrate-binding protein
MRRRLLTVIAMAGVLAAACGQSTSTPSPSSSKQGGTLTVAIGVAPDTLDPMRQTTTTIQNIVQMAVQTLVQVNKEGQLEPMLATSWSHSSDGMTWTFTLRKGVKFSDGEPFNAQAVVTSLDRALDPTNVCPLCGQMPTFVKSVTATDSDHVQFTLSQPVATNFFLGNLSGVQLGILAPNTIQKGTPAYKDDEHPVGTGPYILQEYVSGDHVTMVRNPNYWGKKPAYKEQVIKIVPTAATREALLRAGQAQVILDPPTADLPSLESDPNLKVLLAPDDRTIFISLDTVSTSQPLLQKVQVRQALNYAVDKAAIVKGTLYGAAVPMTAPMAPSLFGYCKMPNQYNYDPTKAKQLLQAAGAEGMTLKLISPTGRYIQDFQAAENVASYLRQVGINVEGPTTMDWPTYVSTLNVPSSKATTDAGLLGWAPGFLDASQQMVIFDGPLQPPKGLNTAYYNNPTVNNLISEAATQINTTERAAEYCQAEKIIWNDAPWIFLWVQKFPMAYSAKVTGVSYVPNESFNTIYAAPA